jgi:hypothetical protein
VKNFLSGLVLIILCSSLVFVFEPVRTKAEAPPMILGIGDSNCKDWIATEKNTHVMNTIQSQWLLGVVTGHNLFNHPKIGSSFLKFDEQNLVDFFLNFCRDNPDKKLFDGIERFFIEDIKK